MQKLSLDLDGITIWLIGKYFKKSKTMQKRKAKRKNEVVPEVKKIEVKIPKKKDVPQKIEQRKTTKAIQAYRRDVTKADMLKALSQSLGLVTPACEKLNISPRTHYRWLKEDASYAENVMDIEEKALDVAENQLHKNIIKGNVPSIIFYLKTKGKKRGYIERSEVEQIPPKDEPNVANFTDEQLREIVANEN
jgi:hypothetical protein